MRSESASKQSSRLETALMWDTYEGECLRISTDLAKPLKLAQDPLKRGLLKCCVSVMFEYLLKQIISPFIRPHTAPALPTRRQIDTTTGIHWKGLMLS